MTSIAYCISPAVYEKAKRLGLLETEISATRDNNEAVVSPIPESIKPIARKVLGYLSESPKFSWDSSFRITYNNQYSEDSDIRDLLLSLVTESSDIYNQKGFKLFLQAVKELVPAGLVTIPNESVETERLEFDQEDPEQAYWIRFEERFSFV
jgi:hypothetical protein